MKVDYDCYLGTYMACLITERVYMRIFQDCNQGCHSEKNKETKEKKKNKNTASVEKRTYYILQFELKGKSSWGTNSQKYNLPGDSMAID